MAELAADINGRVEKSAPGGCTRCWSGCSRRSASPPPTGAGEQITVDAAYVQERVAPLAQEGDLSRFIL